MTARVGAVHLGWDVVSVAAGGGGKPIRPVQVEGTYTPPAYLLADASGRLHTAGVDRRPDVGIAISDVRDIIGHPQIVVAGATWPAELVFRARMHNPLSAITKYLGVAAEVVALPFPDEWPDAKVDEFARLVEQLGVVAEPLPESVALSGYVRALGIVRAAGRGPAVGATGVYSDGRECLVVAVHGDDDQPTESVSVPITEAALHEARAADNVVIEVMAAARAINADTSTVLLTGNVCFNDALRLAFQNHLGHRFQVADHPMHAVVLGATHLLVSDSEGEELRDSPAPQANSPVPQAASPAPQPSSSAHGQGYPAPGLDRSEPSAARPPGPVVDQGPRHVTPGVEPGADVAEPTRRITREAPEPAAASKPPTPPLGNPAGTPPLGTPAPAAAAATGDPVEFEQTQRVSPEELASTPVASRGGLPPGLAGVGGRFTRPPGTPADDRATTVMGRPESGQEPGGQAAAYGAAGTPQSGAGAAGYGQQSGPQQAVPGTHSAGSQGPNTGGYPVPGAAPGNPAHGAQSGPATGGYPVQGPAGGGYGQQYGAPSGQHSAAPGQQQGTAPGQYGPGGSASSGYGQGGYGAQGSGYGQHSGNAPGQAGPMYGGSMPSGGARHSGSQVPEDAAGQPDSTSEAEGDRKPRKGKLWNKMKDNLFGAPIVVGAAALAAVGMHADPEPAHLSGATPEIGAPDSIVGPEHTAGTAAAPAASLGAASFDLRSADPFPAPTITAFGDWPSLERNAVEVRDSCVLTPPAATPPSPGIAPVTAQDCLRLGIDTLRYTIPGPIRGVDPGPPMRI
ncbi:hypothetical protein [Nocardia huaxiensis]|uniref:hypothetical protein n=1 Tax=Nocardia huaxiensis TaxID=2755382 RepID=UPI001E34E51F|nr:hypothetical protein [Nocardia huaxiensis]UFS95482.1 hypothetical protein LPY97_33205 [Nocardia huaxiensis]